ncbi:alpha-ketoglutarate-dependent dioxygenase AlkB [Pseudomonadales bacterium]|nr:alpha-ketoglutarate-dependent dioxygenase AlkB [Pseudomonadales bacterium]
MIKGLVYIPNYISVENEAYMLKTADEAVWDTTLKRRTQHYGWRYDYKARKVTQEMKLGALPHFVSRIAKSVVWNGLAMQEPDQAILNEYQVGQGIGFHIDCEPCFGDKIFSLSLGSSAVMNFKRGDTKRSILLEPRSLLMMYGDARHLWQHSIPSRKSDNGIARTRRVSVTLRTVTV